MFALLLLFGLVFVVYFLGAHAGSQSADRSARERDVINAKADLDTAKNRLNMTTPPSALVAAVIIIVLVILKLFGGWNDGDDRHYHRRRH